MRYTQLPGTDIKVSSIAMGCWALCGDANWGPQSVEDSVSAVRAAFDAGITFFDTAPGYGGGVSEQRLGQGLADFRHEVIVATKVSPENLAPDKLEESLNQSLRDLQMDHVDLLQIHWPNRDIPLAETWGALEQLRASGKVRALGVSNFGRLDLADAVAHGRPCVDQVPYSLLSRAVEYEIAPACEKASVGILCYSPLLWGILTGKYSQLEDIPPHRARSRHFSCKGELARHTEPGCEQELFTALSAIETIARRLQLPMSDLAVAWLLHQPAVTAVLSGIRTADQATSNARAADVQLDEDTLEELNKATYPVKRALGANPDLWQSEPNARFR